MKLLPILLLLPLVTLPLETKAEPPYCGEVRIEITKAVINGIITGPEAELIRGECALIEALESELELEIDPELVEVEK